MTFPDFIICAKCKSKWDTRVGYAPESIEEGICPKCGHPLKEEYKPNVIVSQKTSPKSISKVIRWWKELKGVNHAF